MFLFLHTLSPRVMKTGSQWLHGPRSKGLLCSFGESVTVKNLEIPSPVSFLG